jgi:IS30 family transposase
MNKYRKFARQAKKAYKKHRTCDRKACFTTEEDAAKQAGMKVYLCPYCDSWHRASIFKP